MTVQNKTSFKLSLMILAFMTGAMLFASPKAHAVKYYEFPNDITAPGMQGPPSVPASQWASGNASDFDVRAMAEVGTGAGQGGPQFKLYNKDRFASHPPDEVNVQNTRSEGLYNQYADFEVILPDAMVTNSPIPVHVIDGCQVVADQNGWSDHNTQGFPNSVAQHVRAYPMRVQENGGNFGVKPQSGGPDATCQAGDLVINDIRPYLDPSPRYGANIQSAVVEVYDDTARFGYPQEKKVFGVRVTMPYQNRTPMVGAYVFPTNTAPYPNYTSGGNEQGNTYDGQRPTKPAYTNTEYDIVNLLNPGADYYYEPAGYCHPHKGDPGYPNNCGGMASINVRPDSLDKQTSIYPKSLAYGYNPNGNSHSGRDTFDFYFRPDCTYVAGQTVNLKWERFTGSGSTQPDPESWILYDQSAGNRVVAQLNKNSSTDTFDSYSLSNGRGNALQPGHLYKWSWTGVDRDHGISVWTPYSEFTSTGGYQPATCPRPAGNVVQAQTTCSDVVLDAYDESIPDNGVTFWLYHEETSKPGTLALDINGTATRSNQKFGIDPGDTTQGVGTGGKTRDQIAQLLTDDFLNGGGQVNFYLLMKDPLNGKAYWVMLQYPTPSSPVQVIDPPVSASGAGVSSPGAGELPKPANPFLVKSVQRPCGLACQVTSVAGVGTPGGVIEAGKPITISANIKNTGSQTIATNNQFGLYSGDINRGNGGGLTAYDHTRPPNYVTTGNRGDYGADAFGPSGSPAKGTVSVSAIGPGQTVAVQPFTLTAPNASAPTTVNVSTFAHAGNASKVLGAACPISFRVYQKFHLDPVYNMQFDDEENPTQISYSVGVSTTGTPQGVSVYAGTVSCVYKQTNAATNACFGGSQPANIAGPVVGGTYPPNKLTYEIPPGTAPVTGPIKVGTAYCAEIDMSYTDGYVGPGGPSDVVDPSGSKAYKSCPQVANRPYFRVFNAPVSAGGDFSNTNPTNCNDGGQLANWHNNASGSNYGGGNQLSNSALMKILGFGSGASSAVTPPVGSKPGSALNFANSGTGVNTSSDKSSPELGGIFAQGNCIVAPSVANPASDIQQNQDVGALSSGEHKYNSGNLILEGGQIGRGRNVKIYAPNSDVYIDHDITFDESGATLTNVPAFTLVARNIYIDPTVKELDGWYVAQPDTASTHSTGNIYTCGVKNGTSFDKMSSTLLFSSCKTQLTVFGTFTAQQVNLMRTFGTLRNGNGAAGIDPTFLSGCDNNGGNAQFGAPLVTSLNATCGAEVFRFSPEMYLSNLNNPGGLSGNLQYDTITSLPPVL